MLEEFKFDLSGTNAILLILIIGAALLLFYLEIRKLKIKIEILDKKLESISSGDNSSTQNIDTLLPDTSLFNIQVIIQQYALHVKC